MEKYYWTLESWGSDYPPENAQEIIEWANNRIDDYRERKGESFAVCCYSEILWDWYTDNDDKIRWILDFTSFSRVAKLTSMDDEICEEIHNSLGECSEYVFLLEYCIRHKKKHHEKFTFGVFLDKMNKDEWRKVFR